MDVEQPWGQYQDLQEAVVHVEQLVVDLPVAALHPLHGHNTG